MFVIFGDLTSWFLVILHKSHQNEMNAHERSRNVIKNHRRSWKLWNNLLQNVTKIMKIRSPKIIKNVSFNMIIFHDIWLFFVTFDDYRWFFMIITGDLSWFIVIYHDWSWQITIQLEDSSRSRRGTLKRWWHFVICVWESKQIKLGHAH